jgi:hypothetical protein
MGPFWGLGGGVLGPINTWGVGGLGGCGLHSGAAEAGTAEGRSTTPWTAGGP